MKDIHEYLAYYIGHPCQTDQGSGTIEGVNDTDSCGGTWAVRIGEDYEMFTENDCEWVKPILRRLSDMTKEEATEIAKIQTVEKRQNDVEVLLIEKDRVHYIDGSMWQGDGVAEYNDLYIYFDRLTPDQFHYLLKQGFDLFGLIDAGLAIDSKAL